MNHVDFDKRLDFIKSILKKEYNLEVRLYLILLLYLLDIYNAMSFVII